MKPHMHELFPYKPSFCRGFFSSCVPLCGNVPLLYSGLDDKGQLLTQTDKGQLPYIRMSSGPLSASLTSAQGAFPRGIPKGCPMTPSLIGFMKPH